MSVILKELSKRRGGKPYDILKVEGQHKGRVRSRQLSQLYREERTILNDPVTGKEVWRMTKDPYVNCYRYHDMLVWNANGSMMKLHSHRSAPVYPGRVWLMDADGSNIQSVEAKIGYELNDNYSSGYDIHWSPNNPDILYSLYTKEDETEVRAIDIHKGNIETKGCVPGVGYKLTRPSQDDKRFLMVDSIKNMIYMLDGEAGKVHYITIDRPPKRPLFTRDSDYSIYYTFARTVVDIPRYSLLIDADGKESRELSKYISHPDWSPDGKEMFVYGGGHIWIVNKATGEHKSIFHLGGGGHGSWSLDGEWILSDAGDKPIFGELANMIFLVKVDGSGEVIKLCTHNSTYQGWGRGHIDTESTHPGPVDSPDLTKVAFNSDVGEEYSDLYVVVVKRPEAPKNIRMEIRRPGIVGITWDRPERSKELKGYNLYILEDGITVKMNESPIKGEEFLIERDNDFDVAVTSVEHSGLESELPERFLNALQRPQPVTTLSIVETNQTYIWLQWHASGSKTISHYNIYASEVEDFNCDVAHLIGSPTRKDFIDWGLEANTDYYYKITAVDHWRRQSEPSSMLCARTKI